MSSTSCSWATRFSTTGAGRRIRFGLPSRLSLSILSSQKRFGRVRPTRASAFCCSGTPALLHLAGTDAARLQNRCARMPPLPGPATDSRRDSSARCHPKNPRLARSTLPRPTAGARRCCRYDLARMGLNTGVNRSKKTHAGLVRLQSSRIRHSNLCRTESRDRPASTLHKTAYSEFLSSPKSLKKPSPLLAPRLFRLCASYRAGWRTTSKPTAMAT